MAELGKAGVSRSECGQGVDGADEVARSEVLGGKGTSRFSVAEASGAVGEWSTTTCHTGKSQGLGGHAANLGLNVQWEPIKGVNVGMTGSVHCMEATWEAVIG